MIFSSRARCVCGGVGLCLACGLVLAEAAAGAHHPTPVACVEAEGPDLGPPEGCNEPTQSHSRSYSVSGLASTATANSTSSGTVIFSNTFAASPVVYDPEDYRLPPEPQLTSLPLVSAPKPEWSTVHGSRPVIRYPAPKIERG